MKKFITFLICSFISVFCYSQTPNNTIITDTAKVAVRKLVVGRLFGSYDSGEEECIVKSDSVYRVSFGSTSIHPSGLCKKEKNNNHLDHAGNYLQRSIVYQISAIPCFAVSAILFVSGAKEHSDFMSECHSSSGTYTDNSPAFYVIGGLFGAAGVFCEIKALQMTWKGGRELRLTGNGVVYKF